MLADEKTSHNAEIRTELIVALARAAGSHGMVGGQMIDLLTEHEQLDGDEIARLQQLKTGALIAFACEAGAILGKAEEAERRPCTTMRTLLAWSFRSPTICSMPKARPNGSAKRSGKDRQRGKATFVSLLGVDAARQQARLLAQQAAAHLASFGSRAGALRDFPAFVTNRRS